jgi:small subunit ribosomal protein S9
MEQIHTVGRRKTSVARLYFREGSGTFIINGRDYKEYLQNEVLVLKVNQPFELTNVDLAPYSIYVNAQGGGINGQAEAIRLAISKALCELNPEFRPILKKAGLLTRDSREVERKKYGHKKARKSFQFSKR